MNLKDRMIAVANRDPKIYISKDEVKYILDWMEANKTEYISMRWKPGSLWHHIFVADCGNNGEEHKVPLSENDVEKW